MPLIITCGVGHSWCDYAQERLGSMGVGAPQRSARNDLGIDGLLEGMCQSGDIDLFRGPSSDRQIALGKTWEMANADFFISNMRDGSWGWADVRNIYFLDYWREFEPQAKFILLYGSPADFLASELEQLPTASIDSEALIKYWATYQQAVLNFYHRNRDASILVDISKLDGTTGQLSDLIAKKFGIETRRLNDHQEREASQLLRITAANLPTEILGLDDVLSELESSADLPTMPGAHGSNEFTQAALAELAQFQKASADLQDALEANSHLNCKIQDLEQKIDNAVNENVRLAAIEPKEDDSALVEEIDFLSSRLLQTQSELERYFNKYQDLKQNPVGRDPVAPVVLPNNTMPRDPNNLLLDFRSYIESTGWYGPESHGRWAGPALRSDVHLPSLREGNYQVQLKVVDTISLDILYGLRFLMNGKELNTKFHILSDMGGRLAPIRRIKARVQRVERPLPVIVKANITAADFDDKKAKQTFSVVSPRVVSPADSGQPDDRKLSICVETLELIPRI